MSAAEVDRAVADALRAGADGDEDRVWDLVVRLQIDGGPHALAAAARLCTSPEPAHRELGVDVLAQLGAVPGPPGQPGTAAADGRFREESLTLLLDLVRGEQDPAVLRSIVIGFGHIGDERCFEHLDRLHTHPDADVRDGVVLGLLGRPETVALELLMTLSADPVAQVRDWATFGLARQTDRDFPALRDALAARLADDDEETRAEAIHGLAVRADERATRPLLRELEAARGPGDLDFTFSEALYALAAATADPRLYPHLLADRETCDPDEVPPELAAALARYQAPD